MKKNGLLIVLIISFFVQVVRAQNTPSHVRISLLTCGSGEELYSIFGHTAIRIVDSTRQTDIVYNYGNFDFSDPGFYSKFVSGKLDYYLGISGFADFMYEYQVDKRDVTEQELRLTDSTKLLIQKKLSETLNSPARIYKYDFLYNNCTSRVRDILFTYAGLQPNQVLVPAKTTFRNMLHECLDNGAQPWSKLGIDLLLSRPIDKAVNKTESMFLPNYLMKGVDSSVHSKEGGILLEKKVLNIGSPVQTANRNRPLSIFSILALIIICISFIQNRTTKLITRFFDITLFLLTGLLGCLLLYLWFASDHKEFATNYNVLWALPTNLLVVGTLWKKPRWLQKYFTVCFFIHLLTLLLWFWLPQQLNTALIPITILLLQRCWQLRKPAA